MRKVSVIAGRSCQRAVGVHKPPVAAGMYTPQEGRYCLTGGPTIASRAQRARQACSQGLYIVQLRAIRRAVSATVASVACLFHSRHEPALARAAKPGELPRANAGAILHQHDRFCQCLARPDIRSPPGSPTLVRRCGEGAGMPITWRVRPREWPDSPRTSSTRPVANIASTRLRSAGKASRAANRARTRGTRRPAGHGRIAVATR